MSSDMGSVPDPNCPSSHKCAPVHFYRRGWSIVLRHCFICACIALNATLILSSIIIIIIIITYLDTEYELPEKQQGVDWSLQRPRGSGVCQ